MVTNLPLSYVTLETFLSVYYGRRGTLHKRVRLSEYPETAVILGVYNDFTPDHFLESIRNNPGFDYWLLSDSNQDFTAMEKRVCAEYGIRYMHRGERRGKKAGAINDWARAHLKDYRYYLPLDKDSVLAENNVRDLLEIAEHPSNRGIAAFQSVIFSLSGRSLFSHLRSMIANIYLGQYPRNDALALGEAIYWGHNALVRSEAYNDVGGQNESHLNEDISFTIKLREKGWKIAYVTEVVSYEEQPGDLPSDWERLARWMRGSYESTFVALSKVRKIGVNHGIYADILG
jgi:membrane glycosyltransferase